MTKMGLLMILVLITGNKFKSASIAKADAEKEVNIAKAKAEDQASIEHKRQYIVIAQRNNELEIKKLN